KNGKIACRQDSCGDRQNSARNAFTSYTPPLVLAISASSAALKTSCQRKPSLTIRNTFWVFNREGAASMTVGIRRNVNNERSKASSSRCRLRQLRVVFIDGIRQTTG